MNETTLDCFPFVDFRIEEALFSTSNFNCSFSVYKIMLRHEKH